MNRRHRLLLLALLVAGIVTLIGSWTRRDPAPKPRPASAGSALARPEPRAPLALPPMLAPPATASASDAMAFAGRLVSRLDGRPVERGELTFSRRGHVYSVISAADGAFAFEPPEAGDYQLATVSAEGFLPFAPAWGDSPLAFTARAGFRLADIVIQLEPTRTITAKVTDPSGAPVTSATVSAALPAALNSGVIALAAPVQTDSQGTARVAASVGGIVRAERPGFRAAQRQLSLSDWTRGELALQLAPEEQRSTDLAITGTVVGPDRAPIPELVVTARRSDQSPFEADESWASAPSGSGGQFRIAGLAPGPYTLTASLPGLVPARLENIAAGSTGVVIALDDQGGWIAGQVLAEAGAEPVPSFVVILTQPVGALEERPAATRSFFDAQGAFRLGPLAPGPYVLRIAAHGFAMSKPRPIAVAAGTTTQADVRLLGGGALDGRVVDAANGRGIAGARVALEGAAHGEGLPLALETSALSAADGAFRMAGIAPGTRSVSASAPGYHHRIASGIAIENGRAAGPLELRLTASGGEVKVEITGIGAALAAQRNVLVVGQVLEGGGAAEAGIAVGDEILSINGAPVATMDFEGAMQRIRGPAGTAVVLAVRRANQDRTVTVIRRLVQAPAPPP